MIKIYKHVNCPFFHSKLLLMTHVHIHVKTVQVINKHFSILCTIVLCSIVRRDINVRKLKDDFPVVKTSEVTNIFTTSLYQGMYQ